MSTLTRQYSLLSISIQDCQQILRLDNYTPEDVVDQIFPAGTSFIIPKETFITNFKKTFEKNVTTTSKFTIDDICIRVFDICSQGQNSVTVDQLGKGIGVFTTKRLQNNTIKDLFFSIDKDLKGVLTETSISSYIAEAEKKGIILGNVKLSVEDLKSKIVAIIEKFEMTYWVLYVYRKHDAIQSLLQINGQIATKINISNSYTPSIGDGSPDNNLVRSEVFDIRKDPTPRVTFQEPTIQLRPTKSFNTIIPLKQDEFTPRATAMNTSQTQRPGALTSFDDFISLRNRLGFQLLQPKETLESIKAQIGHVDALRFDEFITFFCDLFKGRYENYYEFVESLTKIFQFIDVDGNGILDISEFLQAIVHLFGGTETEKIAAAFQICDTDGSGFLDLDEIENFLYCTMRLANNKSYKSFNSQEQEELKLIAHATAKDVFFKMDLDNNEKVSFEEFMTWYKGSGEEIDEDEKDGAKAIRSARLNELKNKGAVPLSEEERKKKEEILVKEASDPSIFMKTIEDLRAIVAFERIHIQLAVKLVIDTFPNRNCDFKRFSKFLKDLCDKSNVSGKENANKIALQLFNLLDSNKNGILDIAEIGTGLGLLCGGNMIEKIRAGYDLYDEDNSGRLDFRETSNFLSGFFKIICKNPPPSLANYSPDKLGAILAIKAFEEIGCPFDGVLDFDTFADWIMAK